MPLTWITTGSWTKTKCGMFAGSVASLTVLGAPDLIVLTLSEFAQQALRINRAGNLPLLVDADHGYGNALNVKRTVEAGGATWDDIVHMTFFFTDREKWHREAIPARVEFFAPKAAQPVNGGVPLPVGRPDFKSGWGRQTVSGGFDSHPPPPPTKKVLE